LSREQEAGSRKQGKGTRGGGASKNSRNELAGTRDQVSEQGQDEASREHGAQHAAARSTELSARSREQEAGSRKQRA
jgi:hypothetical protein